MIQATTSLPGGLPLSGGTAQPLSGADDPVAEVKDFVDMVRSIQDAVHEALQDSGSIVSDGNGAPRLLAPTNDMSFEDMAAGLTVLMLKSSELFMDAQGQMLLKDNKNIADIRDRMLEKIKKAADDFAKAQAKRKCGGIFGWLKKAVQFVAAVIFTVVAVSLAVVSGGAAAPVALAALAVLSLATSAMMIANDAVKEHGGKGFDDVLKWMDPASALGNGIGELAKKFGADAQAVAITTACITAAATIALVCATARVSADAFKKVEDVSKTVQTAATIGQAAAGIAGGAAGAVEGGLNIAIAFDERNAALSEADRKFLETVIARMQQRMQEGREDLKKLVEALMDGMTIASQMFNEAHESVNQISRNLGGNRQFG